MKKFLLCGLVGLALVGCGNKSNNYALTTVVTEINTETDEVTCVDFNGNDWIFKGVEDWTVGDYCSMVLNDKGTDVIYDDEIVSVSYSGWLDGKFGYCKGETIIELN